MELEQTKADFAKRGLNVASLTYDTPEVLRHFAERTSLNFPMLSDTESKVIKAFSILNDNIPRDHEFHGVPFPGTYIVNAAGVVEAKFFEADHRERYTATSILVNQFNDEAGHAKTSVETKHLKLTYSASDATARVGNRLALVVDVELKEKMHVYAPGVEGGYIPIAWTMPESKSW
ncbi:MAG: peroxiredoxin family protein, partial [bacterium]|nr:peroxiredoxin family protein [bacterium]